MAKTYHTCHNNGVIALVTDEGLENIRNAAKLDKKLQEAAKEIGIDYKRDELPAKIFTFARVGHPSFRFMTGDFDLLTKLVKGHKVIESHFYVPFSNKIEYQYADMAHEELKFVTNLKDALEVFPNLSVGEDLN